jgi:hypothetical protein
VLGERLGLDDVTALRAVRAAIDAGYLVNNEARPRAPMRLALGARGLAEPDDGFLPTPEAGQTHEVSPLDPGVLTG